MNIVEAVLPLQKSSAAPHNSLQTNTDIHASQFCLSGHYTQGFEGNLCIKVKEIERRMRVFHTKETKCKAWRISITFRALIQQFYKVKQGQCNGKNELKLLDCITVVYSQSAGLLQETQTHLEASGVMHLKRRKCTTRKRRWETVAIYSELYQPRSSVITYVPRLKHVRCFTYLRRVFTGAGLINEVEQTVQILFFVVCRGFKAAVFAECILILKSDKLEKEKRKTHFYVFGLIF